MALRIGQMVTYPTSPGIGRVVEVNGTEAKIEHFESAAEPVARSLWRNVADVRRVRLGKQTRVYFESSDGRWRTGRVVGDDDLGVYYVRVPNRQWDIDIPESDLRVRWEIPPKDPLQVLLSGANETPLYRDAREPVRGLLLAERAATGSATGIMSSGVEIHAHQVSAALRIIRDPVQRYLLADEVGMGKTIQAGLVMRQLLIDDPRRRIGIIVPDALITQWRSELLGKFYLDDFADEAGELPFEILPHSAPHQWKQLQGVDLLAVDEAHVLVRTESRTESPYVELADLAHAIPRVLMLSATPFSRGVTTHLALLHLLDPRLFRWEDKKGFEKLLTARHELALAVFGLDEEPDPDNIELLELQFEEVQRLLPSDDTLRDGMEQALMVARTAGGNPDAVDLEALKSAVVAVRTHISETYRLHHRVIRNRRHAIEKQKLDDEGLLAPFELTGRTRPKVIRLESEEASAGANAVADWLNLCAAKIIDNSLDPVPYGRILSVLVSRVGGSVEDLRNALRYRLTGANDDNLLPQERAILNSTEVFAFEADIFNTLGSVSPDAVEVLADAIGKQCRGKLRAVVFCGRGTVAAALVGQLQKRTISAYGHLADQIEMEREVATARWRANGGVLVVDESGEVGRNFQESDRVFHVRLPANPNSLEQRIGRVDRYGRHRPAQQFIIADLDPDGLLTAWAKLLASGFEVFSTSISALQEAVDDLAGGLWTSALTDGLEGFADQQNSIVEVLRLEKRRVNELDALESGYGVRTDGEQMALAIGSYENDTLAIESNFTKLIVGAEGFRLTQKSNADGSSTFDRDVRDTPLLSPRLQGKIDTSMESRTGFFDRGEVVKKPSRRIFRRGNPFIDGLEELLGIDDRGQAVAMWRLNQRWTADPMIFFGFDFLIEADLRPMLELLKGQLEVEPIARRRADAALAPQRRRVWIPAHTLAPVSDPEFAEYLSRPYKKGPDQNLNSDRIRALHSLLGGERNLEPVANSCFTAARENVGKVIDAAGAAKFATHRIRAETEVVLAQSRARAKAGGLVADTSSLDDEVAIGRALEAGVSEPAISLSGVSCVVVSPKSWVDYV
ncbi:restriction endonuclease subunit R [Rhodococcus sp. ARC_M12]|uniref:protein DpdE n=1 Tax=Rhodococcus sp. ARC_M12 TaxID=2928854 RepID=UPI001FB36481|nr:protein DpdE [Rhodococcus sp. ARC_M12]MCJ0978714.1 restriction endonuclease subunit R [Rhodococcus sp. ARC_M12]